MVPGDADAAGGIEDEEEPQPEEEEEPLDVLNGTLPFDPVLAPLSVQSYTVHCIISPGSLRQHVRPTTQVMCAIFFIFFLCWRLGITQRVGECPVL